MKKTLYIIASVILAVSCAKVPQGSADNSTNGGNDNEDTAVVPEVPKIQSMISVQMQTDKVLYAPGGTVHFTAENMPANAKVRYRCMGETVHEHDATGNEWTWTAPEYDGRGYMVEVWTQEEDNVEMINGIQFYDWHNKHHWPLGGTMEQLDEVYKDIANRDVYNEAVKKYIDVQHGYGMGEQVCVRVYIHGKNQS